MTNYNEHEYLNLLDMFVLMAERNKPRIDRTGVGTYSVFGEQLRIDLSEEFIPLLTTKKVHFKSVLVELLWFLSGETNTKYLKDHGVSIWDEWADKEGELGPVYGSQWRSWYTGPGTYIDQIANVINSLKNNPFSRRHIVSAWNVAEIEQMALPPCHAFFQFYVAEENNQKYLSCHLYQRSCDIFLGLPFNIASYALLTRMIAQQVNMIPKLLIISFGDLHLYANHLDQAREQLSRDRDKYYPPTLTITPAASIDEYTIKNFKLGEYRCYPAISAPIAV